MDVYALRVRRINMAAESTAMGCPSGTHTPESGVAALDSAMAQLAPDHRGWTTWTVGVWFVSLIGGLVIMMT
jgi:hypothetical protein